MKTETQQDEFDKDGDTEEFPIHFPVSYPFCNNEQYPCDIYKIEIERWDLSISEKTACQKYCRPYLMECPDQHRNVSHPGWSGPGSAQFCCWRFLTFHMCVPI